MSTQQKFLIWSEEHGAWWSPHRAGYTRSIKDAGRYAEADARKIVEAANKYLSRDEWAHELLIPDPCQFLADFSKRL